MNVKGIDCNLANEHDLGARYLTGSLSAPEAEAFETHFLGCSRCWDEIRQAGELREALARPFTAPALAGTERESRDFWTPLAAAAVIAVLAVGLGRLSREPDPGTESPVVRGSEVDALEPTVEPGPDGTVILEWQPHPDASIYRVDVIRTDGLRVFRSETPDSRLELGLSDLPPIPPGVSLLAKIEAFNVLGRAVGRSRPVLLVLP